jgi:hypothetical protein
MSATSSILLAENGTALIRCTSWLGWCWLGAFIAWLIVLMLWIRQLGRYNRAYRKYEQCRREYEKNYRQPSEDLRLVQERLRDIQKNPGVILKLLHRLGLILGQSDIEGDSGEVKILAVGIHSGDKMGKLLNVPGRSGNKKLLHFGRLLLMAGGKCRRFLGCHSDNGVKPNARGELPAPITKKGTA